MRRAFLLIGLLLLVLSGCLTEQEEQSGACSPFDDPLRTVSFDDLYGPAGFDWIKATYDLTDEESGYSPYPGGEHATIWMWGSDDLRQSYAIYYSGNRAIAVYRKRFLPLAWRVLPFGGTAATTQQALLRQIQPALPPLSQVRVHFYGDSEFRAAPLQQQAQRYAWHWQVGLKRDLLYHTGDEQWRPLAYLSPARGQRRYLQGVTLTHKHAFGPVNLLIDWALKQDAPRFWNLDLPADRQAWRRGRKRFWIEPGFRDWKSHGFDLEASHLDDPLRLNMLLLAIALTNLWMIHIGDWLGRTGRQRDLIAAHKPQDRSLFQLGRAYLQRVQVWNASIPVGFTVRH